MKGNGTKLKNVKLGLTLRYLSLRFRNLVLWTQSMSKLKLCVFNVYLVLLLYSGYRKVLEYRVTHYMYGGKTFTITETVNTRVKFCSTYNIQYSVFFFKKAKSICSFDPLIMLRN